MCIKFLKSLTEERAHGFVWDQRMKGEAVFLCLINTPYEN